MTINELVFEYLNSKRDDWASSTQDSERHRLAAVKDLLDGKPQRLWDGTQHLGRYSRNTTWSRASEFWQWCIDHGHKKGPNPYQAFRKEKSARFKNAYTRRTPDVSFEEAVRRISGLSDSVVRAHCQFLLSTGARFAESLKYDASGFVEGKGGRTRQLQIPGGFSTDRTTYSRVRRALATVGLKPHTLRKILLTELARRGANAFVLMEVAGWSSIAPATSYITAVGAREMMKELHGQQYQGHGSPKKQIPTVLQGEPGPNTGNGQTDR